MWLKREWDTVKHILATTNSSPNGLWPSRAQDNDDSPEGVFVCARVRMCVYLVSFLSIWVSNGLWTFPRQQWQSELVRSRNTLNGSNRKWQFGWPYSAKGRFLLNIISLQEVSKDTRHSMRLGRAGKMHPPKNCKMIHIGFFFFCSMRLILKCPVFCRSCLQLNCMVIATAGNVSWPCAKLHYS